jgi:hypothetical protein
VRRALLRLRAFGDLDRAQVRKILPMWRNFTDLTPAELLAIIASFPPGDDDPDQAVSPFGETEAGTLHRGGGWISGTATGGREDA